jgi:hypothetical protein
MSVTTDPKELASRPLIEAQTMWSHEPLNRRLGNSGFIQVGILCDKRSKIDRTPTTPLGSGVALVPSLPDR